MAHEFETGFVTREPAWHGLGTVVKEAPTSADALHLAGLDWDVTQEDVTVGGIVVPGYRANVRSTDKSVLGIVSDRYQIVQNTEAFDFTDALLGEGVQYETAGSLKHGKTIWLLAKMDTAKVLGEDITPYMCFTNTHDGTGAVHVCMTPTRVVCNNTLNLALNTAQRMWSTRHMGDISTKLVEAKETLHLANEYMTAFDKEANKLATQRVSDKQIDNLLDEVFGKAAADTDRKKQNVEDAKKEFYICYFSPDLVNYLNTVYGVINAMADMVDHKASVRASATYAENNFGRIINGHAILDKTYAVASTLI